LEYVTFDPKLHNTRKVATLIYDVDFRTFDRLFKSSKKAIDAIEKDLRKEECLKVVLDNGEMVGILMYYTSHTNHEFRLKHYKLFIVDFLDYFVLCDIKEGDFYLAEIAIDESMRSKGYGGRIIQDVLEYARKNNYKRVTLDADLEMLGQRHYMKRWDLKYSIKNLF